MTDPDKTDDSAWVTAADVARRAGVSRSAVSRTFTEGASVSADTRAKVLQAAEALGYQVNMLARSMIQRQSNLVGVVVAGFDNPFLLSLLGPLAQHLAERSLAPLLMDASHPEQLVQTLRHLLQYRIAGAILTSGAPPIDLAREYLRLRIPVTMINREPGLEGVDVVNSDHRGGGAMAADLLRAGGATRLAFLATSAATHSGRERGDGFARALAADIRQSRVVLTKSTATAVGYAGGYAAAARLLADPATRPHAVFCANDALACGLLDGVRAGSALQVPHDLQVMGFDDIPLAGLSAYALTTVRQDVDALARQAVASLCERMASPGMPARVQQLPVVLVQRATAGPAAAAGANGAAAGAAPRPATAKASTAAAATAITKAAKAAKAATAATAAPPRAPPMFTMPAAATAPSAAAATAATTKRRGPMAAMRRARRKA